MQQQRSHEMKKQFKLQEMDSNLINNKRQIENQKNINQKRYDRNIEKLKYENLKLEAQKLAEQYGVVKK